MLIIAIIYFRKMAILAGMAILVTGITQSVVGHVPWNYDSFLDAATNLFGYMLMAAGSLHLLDEAQTEYKANRPKD